MIRTYAQRLHNMLFLTVVCSFPLNLGLHFVLKSSYVGGLLVDYLIPTVYIQDIFVLLYIVSSFTLVVPLERIALLKDKRVTLVLWFCFALIVSSLLSDNVIPSLAQALRLSLYTLFYLSITLTNSFKGNFVRITKIFVITLLYLSILGFAQLYLQHSLFNNYLFFGEQPYTRSTSGITKENVFGVSLIPPYGLFRHPNIFAGFLVILITWVFYAKKENIFDGFFVDIALYSSIILVIFTWSAFALFSLVIALLFVLFGKIKHSRIILISFVIIFVLSGFFINFLKDYAFILEYSSVYRRIFLLDTTYQVLQTHWLTGVGSALISDKIDGYIPWTREVRFVQPVHNIFVLLFSEAGIISFTIFFVLLLNGFLAGIRNKSILAISLLLLCIMLGTYDHYLLTIHQPMLLLWFVLSFAVSKELDK